LRYFSYQPKTNDFKILLDKGDTKDIADTNLKSSATILLDYFKIGLSLPNDKFWVNLRPDSQDEIIDDELAKTDLGKVMLEADLKLKQDTALFTSPQTPQGKEYWNKLYQRAGELFGTENITIPTLTRPWIVPGEIILRESSDNNSKASQGAYIYKANLKVMLEEDYLKNSNQKPVTSNQIYSFNDPRLKELNLYSTQLIRELILPKLTQKVNSSKDYANLRQVYFSLILARWFKETYKGRFSGGNSLLERTVPMTKLIDSGDLTNLTSKEAWDKSTYFNAYQKSFKEGEYNLSEPVYTPTGQVIRRYMSGGMLTMPTAEQIKNTFKIEGDPTSSAAEANDKVLFLNGEKVRKTGAIQDNRQIEKTAASAIEATAEKANFTQSLTGIIRITPNNIIILDEARFKSEGAEILAKAAAVAANPDVKASARRILQEIGLKRGIIPASIDNLYKKMAKKDSTLKKFTVPAFNIRTLTLESMRRIFREAAKIDAGAIILELALSEKGYTAQPPAEYWAIANAAAIMEDYQGHIFLQADHYQKNAEKFVKNRDEVREKSFKEIKEAIEGGYFGIDSDNSTIVPSKEVIEDLEGEASKATDKAEEAKKKLETQKKLLEYADEIFASWSKAIGVEDAVTTTANTLTMYNQQGYYARIISECDQKLSAETKADKKAGLIKLRETMERFTQRIKEDTLGLAKEIVRDQIINAQETAMDTLQVRALEPEGITVTVGGEIGEVGKKNSEPGEFTAFTELYNKMLGFMTTKIAQGKEDEILQIVGSPKGVWSKEALYNLRTKYNQYQTAPGLRKIAIQTGTGHGVGGQIDFKAMQALAQLGREYGVLVVQHGASTLPESEFSKIMENGAGEVHLATDYMTVVLRDLKANHQDIYQTILKDAMEKTKKSEDELWKKAAEFRNSLTLIKESTYNLSKSSQERIGDQLAIKFSNTMKSLGVENTRNLVKDIVPALTPALPARPSGMLEMFIASSAVELKSDSKSSGSPATIMVLANNLSLLEGAQTRGYNVSHAILDEYNGGILNHSEARFNLEVKTENALKSIFSESHNFKNGVLALASAEETAWKQTLKTEGISDAEYAEYFSFEKDEYLSKPHIGVTDKARHTVNRIINLQLKKVIASTRGDKGYKNVRQVVLCVGETLAQREPARKNIILDEDVVNALLQEGRINAVIEEDIKDILKGITKEDVRDIGLRIAYEPRWAIGTGKTPTTNEIQRMHRFIKYTLSRGNVLGIELDVDYGGSLKSKNAKEILSLPDVDGGLIGGAAKTVGEIEPIIKEAIIQGEKKGKILNIGMNWKAETEGTGLASLKSFVEFFKDPGLDLSKVTIAIGTPQVGTVKSVISSSAIIATEKTAVSGQTIPLGGIDFRSMNMLIQPQGSFASSSLDFSLPALSRAEIESFDLDKELSAIQKMASSGIAPSDERLKEYLAVCFARERTGLEIDSLKLCLLDIFERQQFEAKETPNGYKEVLVIADTRGYVLKEGRLAASGQRSYSLN